MKKQVKQNMGMTYEIYCIKDQSATKNNVYLIVDKESKKRLSLIWHTYHELPGKPISYLKHNNIYFILEDEKQFVEFRMRKNQTNLFDFK